MNRIHPLFQQEQVEKLRQIGDYLRQIRQQYQWSLDDVASRTLIQTRLLKAIEAGELHQLPEPVYIQAYIKRYADTLGLDGNEIAEAFPTGQTQRLRQGGWKSSRQLRPVHLYLGYIGLIMASVSLLSYVVGRSAPSASTTTGGVVPAPQSTTVLPSASPAAPRRAAPAGSLAAGKPNAQPVQIQVKLTSQSWIRVVADGKTAFEGVLSEGTERQWTAKSEITVRSGNAGGVMIAYNSDDAKPMGDPGAVEEKTFTPTQDAASLPLDSLR